MRVVTLKRRSEFLRLRDGARWAAPAFVLAAKARGEGAAGPRFGLTVTRRLGKAVARNRIKRRLKAAIAGAAAHGRREFDYVLIARSAALTLPFAQLVADLSNALDRIHRSTPRAGRRKETGKTLAG